MKGFIIDINEEKKYVGIDNGVVVIVVDETSLHISATNNASGFSLDFGQTTLKLGDKIKISVSEMEENSVPLSSKPLNRQKLLLEYNKLKAFLIKEGRLSR